MSLLRLDRLHYCILMSMGCISSPLVWAEDLNSDVAKLPTLHVEATRTDTGCYKHQLRFSNRGTSSG